MSNLHMCREIEGTVSRGRFIRTMFPGALPYILRRAGTIVSYHVSREEALAASVMPDWSRWTTSIVGDAMVSSFGDLVISFGAEDWPAEEVAKRVVLVGELNPYQDRPDFDLYDLPVRASGHRLRTKVLGVSREDYFRRYYRRNLCVGKWSVTEARKRAAELCREFAGHTFVLLGKEVHSAFGLYSVNPFDRVYGPDLASNDQRAVLIPHPSGLSRAWNEPGSFQRARALIEEVTR